MKKNLLLIITVLSLFNLSFAQVFSENWNTSTGWNQVDADGDGFVWTFVDLTGTPAPNASFGKSIVSFSVNTSNGAQLNPDNYLYKSAGINLSGLTGKTFLLFDATITDFDPTITENENISIYYSTSPIPTGITGAQMTTNISGGVYPLIATRNINVPNTILQQSVDLTALHGQTIYLIFRHHNATTRSSIFMDNIYVVNSDFTVSNTTACVGSPVTFNNTSRFNTSAVTVEWNFNNGSSNSTAAQEVVTFSNAQNYTVQQIINGVVMETKVINVVNSPTPTFEVSFPTPPCNPLVVTLTTGPGSGYEFSFSDGVRLPVTSGNTATRTLTRPGIYDVYVVQTIDASCLGWDSLSGIGFVNVIQSPKAAFEPTSQRLDMLYPSVTFINKSIGDGLTYVWDFGDTSVNETIFSPLHIYPLNQEGNYDVKLYALSVDGCIDSTAMRIIVEESVLFFIPNSFSPNGDEYNNTFKPIMTAGFDPTTYQLSIYNKWGQLVFESKDPSVGWDGDFGAGNGVLNTGLYTYKLFFNTAKNDEVRTIVGHITLMK
jgi:gliding motility-associated-like protein